VHPSIHSSALIIPPSIHPAACPPQLNLQLPILHLLRVNRLNPIRLDSSFDDDDAQRSPPPPSPETLTLTYVPTSTSSTCIGP
jgi:hypothetical protein